MFVLVIFHDLIRRFVVATVHTRRLVWVGAILRMPADRLPKRMMSHEPDGTVDRERREKERDYIGYVKKVVRAFDIQRDWKVMARDGSRWYEQYFGETEGARRFKDKAFKANKANWKEEEEYEADRRR